MTGTAASADQVASRLRQAAAATRELSIDLQHESWSGESTHNVEIANLSRAVDRLEDAAQALVGSGFPKKRVIVASAVSTGLFAAAATAVLTTVPQPGRPSVIVFALVTGWVAADIFSRANIAIQWRRLTVEHAEPLNQKIPTTDHIRQIRANVDEILHLVTSQKSHRGDQAAEDVRAAQIWLAEAENGAKEPP